MSIASKSTPKSFALVGDVSPTVVLAVAGASVALFAAGFGVGRWASPQRRGLGCGKPANASLDNDSTTKDGGDVKSGIRCDANQHYTLQPREPLPKGEVDPRQLDDLVLCDVSELEAAAREAPSENDTIGRLSSSPRGSRLADQNKEVGSRDVEMKVDNTRTTTAAQTTVSPSNTPLPHAFLYSSRLGSAACSFNQSTNPDLNATTATTSSSNAADNPLHSRISALKMNLLTGGGSHRAGGSCDGLFNNTSASGTFTANTSATVYPTVLVEKGASGVVGVGVAGGVHSSPSFANTYPLTASPAVPSAPHCYPMLSPRTTCSGAGSSGVFTSAIISATGNVDVLATSGVVLRSPLNAYHPHQATESPPSGAVGMDLRATETAAHQGTPSPRSNSRPSFTSTAGVGGGGVVYTPPGSAFRFTCLSTPPLQSSSLPPLGMTSASTASYRRQSGVYHSADGGILTQAAFTSHTLKKMPRFPIWRICVTGGPCSGKSTSMPIIKKELEACGFRVYVVPEVATIMINGGLEFGNMTREKRINQQTVILQTIMMLEDSFYELAKGSLEPSILLCDRGTLDGSAYCSAEEFEEILGITGYTIAELRDARYDAIVHLVTTAIGASSAYTTANNEARRESAEEASDLDRRTREKWNGHRLLGVFDNSTSFHAKCSRVVQFIKRIARIARIHEEGPATNVSPKKYRKGKSRTAATAESAKLAQKEIGDANRKPKSKSNNHDETISGEKTLRNLVNGISEKQEKANQKKKQDADPPGIHGRTVSGRSFSSPPRDALGETIPGTSAAEGCYQEDSAQYRRLQEQALAGLHSLPCSAVSKLSPSSIGSSVINEMRPRPGDEVDPQSSEHTSETEVATATGGSKANLSASTSTHSSNSDCRPPTGEDGGAARGAATESEEAKEEEEGRDDVFASPSPLRKAHTSSSFNDTYMDDGEEEEEEEEEVNECHSSPESAELRSVALGGVHKKVRVKSIKPCGLPASAVETEYLTLTLEPSEGFKEERLVRQKTAGGGVVQSRRHDGAECNASTLYFYVAERQGMLGITNAAVVTTNAANSVMLLGAEAQVSDFDEDGGGGTACAGRRSSSPVVVSTTCTALCEPQQNETAEVSTAQALCSGARIPVDRLVEVSPSTLFAVTGTGAHEGDNIVAGNVGHLRISHDEFEAIRRDGSRKVIEEVRKKQYTFFDKEKYFTLVRYEYPAEKIALVAPFDCDPSDYPSCFEYFGDEQ